MSSAPAQEYSTGMGHGKEGRSGDKGTEDETLSHAHSLRSFEATEPTEVSSQRVHNFDLMRERTAHQAKPDAHGVCTGAMLQSSTGHSAEVQAIS